MPVASVALTAYTLPAVRVMVLPVLLALVEPVVITHVPPASAIPALSKTWNVTFAGKVVLSLQKNFGNVSVSPIKISKLTSGPVPSPELPFPIQALALFGRAPALVSLINVTAAAAALAADCTNAVVAICVVFVPAAAVGAVGVPAKAGEVASTIAPEPEVPFVKFPAEG